MKKDAKLNFFKVFLLCTENNKSMSDNEIRQLPEYKTMTVATLKDWFERHFMYTEEVRNNQKLAPIFNQLVELKENHTTDKDKLHQKYCQKINAMVQPIIGENFVSIITSICEVIVKIPGLNSKLRITFYEYSSDKHVVYRIYTELGSTETLSNSNKKEKNEEILQIHEAAAKLYREGFNKTEDNQFALSIYNIMNDYDIKGMEMNAKYKKDKDELIEKGVELINYSNEDNK